MSGEVLEASELGESRRAVPPRRPGPGGPTGLASNPGGTFTIAYVDVLGLDTGTPIINSATRRSCLGFVKAAPLVVNGPTLAGRRPRAVGAGRRSPAHLRRPRLRDLRDLDLLGLGRLTGALTRQTFHDALTVLCNRLFTDRLNYALTRRDGEDLVALFLALDNFKMVNDDLGHHARDAVLAEVRQRVVSVARPWDTVARLGGHELAILADAASLPTPSWQPGASRWR